MPDRHPDNAPGPWYIDTKCIDCSAARTVAPGLIVERGGQSVFARQPETPDELRMAWRARLLCPTASVRSDDRAEPPADLFPERMTDDVWRLGYNARSSYGAHSFLLRRAAGNVMIDAPRWTGAVAKTIAAWGGLGQILLTHQDDVADAERYARHFGARVAIHAADRDAAPYAETVLEGRAPIVLADDLLAIPVPGHTRGSVAYLWRETALFTGDSLSWSFARGDLFASKEVCWYSWPEQTRSLERLLAYRFQWIFAGHGGSYRLPPEEMHARLAALVARMRRS
jgi:glyoxylase-like metal-dependent hydrolase (beta-lactamase superfamily II)